MKITLFALNASYTHTSLALRCLRPPLEEKGFEVTLVERNLRDRTSLCLAELYESAADVYGFSVYIWNISEMLSLAADLHTLRPDAAIVFGGPEASFGLERFTEAEAPFLTSVIIGPGEEAFSELCETIRAGGTPPRFLSRPPKPAQKSAPMQDSGILYRDGDYPPGTMLYYESSRGCPFHCAYCLSSVSDGVSMKPVDAVLRDLDAFEALDRRFSIIKFVDRTFNCDKKRANRIWEALADERYTKKYQFEICADLLDEESYAILERLPKGKVQFEIGLQSTNPETLREVSRHTDPASVLRASERIRRQGNIHVHLDLIAGLPYEGYRRFGQSFDDAYAACDLLQLGFLKLLHGTALRRDAERYGIRYSAAAPYTVLSTNWISYPELEKLHRIADLLQRFREGKGFERTLPLLISASPSPFGFFESFDDFLRTEDGRPIRSIGQPEAYALLWRYAVTIDGVDLPALEDAMHRDFLGNEHKNPPRTLFVPGRK